MSKITAWIASELFDEQYSMAHFIVSIPVILFMQEGEWIAALIALLIGAVICATVAVIRGAQ